GNMGKKNRSKREERQQRAEEEAEQRALEEARRKKRSVVVYSLPVVILAGAAAANYAFEMPKLSGGILLVGAIVWLMVALGFVGASVKPRDRNRAGSIDYGRK
ncbi:MAG: hypothetical protein KC416_15160, partial [Myxococcales bacterium]|nr:hypothetical protein [Myxococcales bacterium]